MTTAFVFGKQSNAYKRASIMLGTPVYWGGDWTGKKDRPHFSLVKG